MKKATTEYYANLMGSEYETLHIKINEEVEDKPIQISFNMDRWRTKENTKKVLEEIIKQIDTI
jgi:uncharacterized protein YukJ